jgi:hypothetical protein
MSGTEAAAYCGVTLNTWSKWVAAGTMPPPVAGTRRWDRKAIDLTLDKASNIVDMQQPALHVAGSGVTEEECPLEKWMREDAARQGVARTSHGYQDARGR